MLRKFNKIISALLTMLIVLGVFSPSTPYLSEKLWHRNKQSAQLQTFSADCCEEIYFVIYFYPATENASGTDYVFNYDAQGRMFDVDIGADLNTTTHLVYTGYDDLSRPVYTQYGNGAILC